MLHISAVVRKIIEERGVAGGKSKRRADKVWTSNDEKERGEKRTLIETTRRRRGQHYGNVKKKLEASRNRRLETHHFCDLVVELRCRKKKEG